MTHSPAGEPANLLAEEKSPYLRQHAHNPVAWRPWGQAALAAAREADKPLLLSIGYSTCHWCHVMANESFEDREVAAALNEHFVCVKVDREERPDVDAVYMTACQMVNGHGGWPLTIFATPDGEPFFSATYMPPRTRMGRMGLLDMAVHVGRLWREDKKTLTTAAGQVATHLAQFYAGAAKAGAAPGAAALDAARSELVSRFDQRFGGFGGAPKFPTPHNLVFLLREARRTGREEPRRIALRTLEAMRLGGIWDHVGLGFHRYSTDERWLLPHFEKMLYDQAGLALAYLEGFLESGAPLLARTAEEIFEYVLRDLAAPDGGFYSAEDADSEGEEGRFYVWTVEEIVAALGADNGSFVTTRLGMLAGGNFRDEATGEMPGGNIAHLRAPLSGPDEARWEMLRPKLFALRQERVRPHRDEKILADWNGLMITALARGARVLDRAELADAAGRAADFVLGAMRTGDGGLLRRWCDGQAAVPAQADDYANMVRGLLELYAATLDPRRLAQALELQRIMDRDFLDTDGGGYFLSPDRDPGLPARPKELYDGPVPSANSTALGNLLTLARLTGDKAHAERAQALTEHFGGNVAEQPTAYCHFLTALSRTLAPSADVVVAGTPGAPDTEALLSALRPRSLAGLRLQLRAPDDALLPELAPFTAPLTPQGGKAAAYVCRNFSCEKPVTSVDELAALLAG